MFKKKKPEDRNWISFNSSAKLFDRNKSLRGKNENTQENIKYWLCDDSDETNNLFISKYSQLAQREYINDWVGKAIHNELYKRLQFDNTNKCYIHKAESFLENEII